MFKYGLTAVAILLCASMLVFRAKPAHENPWLFSMPTTVIAPDSGKRSNVFYVGEHVHFALRPLGRWGDPAASSRYEVRDYFGNLVDSGSVSHSGAPGAIPEISPKATLPGWYKLYIYGAASQPQYGDSLSGTTFVIFRNDPHFPALPAATTSGGVDGDAVMRGITGMGPQRHYVADADNPDPSIARLDKEIALDKQYYLPYDPLRRRSLMISFPNGTKNLDGVKKIVTHFQNDVEYWEPRNEPNGGSAGSDFALKEMKPFYETVKAVNPHLKVLGPGTVGIGPAGHMLGWIEDFLKAGGGKYIDAFSFHAYNAVNGDPVLVRESLDALDLLLQKYGLGGIEKWQTEQGYYAAMYGVYAPRHQGRWTMLQMILFEQYGIPKEHNHLWYDKSHGYWDKPAFWENDDGSLNPAAALMRVWSEELYGTRFKSALRFGPTGDDLYMGDRFEGPGKTVLALMSAGDPDGKVTLNVTGGTKLRLVSAFGIASEAPVIHHQATIPVPEIPIYVEPAPGQDVRVAPIDLGQDLALQPGTVATASGTGARPGAPNTRNDISSIINGTLENWYYAQDDSPHPWMDDTPEGRTAWVQIALPRAQTISHVLIFAGVPWQNDGSLLDYELQYDRNGRWVTIDHVREDPKTVPFYTSKMVSATTVDSFYSDRCLFQHEFKPVTTQRIRLLVHDTTWGGGATKEVAQAGGQSGLHQIVLREVEIFH